MNLNRMDIGCFFKRCVFMSFLLSIMSCDQSVSEIAEEKQSEQYSYLNKYNLLRNGGYEKWSDGVIPDSWSYNNCNIKKSLSSYTGTYAAQLSSLRKGETAKLYQRIPVDPGHTIRIVLHYYIEKWSTNGARMYCYFRTNLTDDISNDRLRLIYSDYELNVIRGGGYGQPYFSSSVGCWQNFDGTIKVPKNAHFFVLEIHSYYGTIICIDDCYVVDI